MNANEMYVLFIPVSEIIKSSDIEYLKQKA